MTKFETFTFGDNNIGVRVGCVTFAVATPSRQRAAGVSRSPLLSVANLIVHESEHDTYAAHFEKHGVCCGRLHTHNVKGIGNIRNLMLERYFGAGIDFVFTADDDVKCMQYMVTRGSKAYSDLPTILGIIASAGYTASQIPVGMFGFHQSGVPFERRAQIPFYLRGWTSSHAAGFLDRTLRYDTTLKSHDDIDICLQSISKYKLLWRDERWYFRCYGEGDKTQVGGMAAHRSSIVADEALRQMQAKWGDDVILPGPLTASGMAVRVHLS